MALLAGLSESRSRVRRIIGRLKIVQVAAYASGVRRRQVVVAIYVARGASDGGMRSGQRESRRRVVKRSATPVRGGVALLASLREVRLHVIRIRGSLEVSQVAARARRVSRRQVVVSVYVALYALQGHVRARKRESSRRVVERRIPPGSRGMALLASLREVRLHVIRIGRALEILQVAADASRIRAGQIVVAIHVATGASNGRVRASQRESSGRVIEGRARPVGGAVTLLASLREARA